MFNELTIYFDGGCAPTNPGNKYGSYEVLLDGQSAIKRSRVRLGWGTNNEAEWETLILALQACLNAAVAGGWDPAWYCITAVTDSKILVNRLEGRNRSRNTEPQQRMARYCRATLELASHFGSFEIEWEGREANVQRFGH